jgi:hypothetical protein
LSADSRKSFGTGSVILFLLFKSNSADGRDFATWAVMKRRLGCCETEYNIGQPWAVSEWVKTRLRPVRKVTF